MEERKPLYDLTRILKTIPHRYPFVLIDRVTEFEDGERIVAYKNVTFNEQFFQGHFPEKPVMPGVLILEAMAQTAAILAIDSTEGVMEGKIVYLVGADNVKWKKQVVPGDCIRIEMKSVKRRRPIWIMSGEVTVDGKVVASGTISAVESE